MNVWNVSTLFCVCVDPLDPFYTIDDLHTHTHYKNTRHVLSIGGYHIAHTCHPVSAPARHQKTESIVCTFSQRICTRRERKTRHSLTAPHIWRLQHIKDTRCDAAREKRCKHKRNAIHRDRYIRESIRIYETSADNVSSIRFYCICFVYLLVCCV